MTRTIVVTGGSSGIGLAAAEQLAAQGDDVVLAGRDPGRLAAAVARVRAPDPHDFTGDPGTYTGWVAYGAAKSANILFAAEAARRWPDMLSVSFHPGVVRTNFGDRGLLRFLYKYAPFLVAPEKAGAVLAWLLTVPAADLVNGAYYEGHGIVVPRAWANDADLAAELWKTSAAAVGIDE
jgi:NAD(P)-dependent dehydrogenase (short-subunit alcohol dehydrogenase family)